MHLSDKNDKETRKSVNNSKVHSIERLSDKYF